MKPFERQPSRPVQPRRGLVLVVVIVMVALLALLAASYTFMVRAHAEAVWSDYHAFQARMAAESGVQRAMLTIRDNQGEFAAWYDNPDVFRGNVVVSQEAGLKVFENATDVQTYDPYAEPAWRFNVVARNYDDPTTVRYGLTDQCSKLDLNLATESQLRRLFEAVIPEDANYDVDLDVLIDSLLDWREPGDTARPSGAKDAFYQALKPPYSAKKGPFSTVEELLLVQGFTAWVVFGEDYNRNGLLDPEEDDGDVTFPLDNADGALFTGVAPFLTVWSRETNVANDGRSRIFLNEQDTQKLQEKLEEFFDASLISYVLEVRESGGTFNSVMNLVPAPPPPEQEDREEEDATSAPSDSADPSASESDSDDENASDTGEGTSDQEQSEASDSDDARDEGEEAEEEADAAPPPLPEFTDLTEFPPPGDISDLPLILDRLTVNPTPALTGRINVNSASREVLLTLEELTEEQVDAIVAARQSLDADAMSTPAWLVAQGVLDLYTFRRIVDKITNKSSVYHVEAVGYADHLGVIKRIGTVFEMRGPIPQVLYTRDLTGLGPAYMPHGLEQRGIADQSY